MAALTALTNLFGTANGTKQATGTPAVGDLIVIVTAHTVNTSAATPTDDQGGTYTLVASAAKASSADTLSIFVRNSLIASAVSTVFTHAPGTTSGGGLVVCKVTGMSRAGSSAIVQSATQANQASGTPAPTFGAAPASANPIIGAVFNASNPAALTPRTNFTELFEDGYSSPTAGLEVMSRDSGETATTQTWGSSSATAFSAIVAELDTSAPPAGGSGTGNFFQFL